jgi:hypothetical protein
MDQYDQRQLNKMYELIGAFKNHRITLSSFVSSVEFLFHALENADASWEELFLDELSNLESVNSGIPNGVDKKTIDKIVDDSITHLYELVKQMRE